MFEYCFQQKQCFENIEVVSEHFVVQLMFEDTQWVISSRESKDTQYNDQQKKDKITKNDKNKEKKEKKNRKYTEN